MAETTDSLFTGTGQASSDMFEILDATRENVVAIRMDHGSPRGYQEFYELLINKTEEFGTVHVYEETTNWTLRTYLSHLHGVLPDLREGPKFTIGRYAAVGDTRWAKLLFYQWRGIAPVWPVAPNEMQYYELKERTQALEWVSNAPEAPDLFDNP